MSQTSFPTVLTDEQFIQSFLNQLKQRGAELGSTVVPSDLTPVGMPAIGSAHLQSLLDAIPYANDGDVIRADHFNTIRAALVQLAAELGLSSRPLGVGVVSIFPTQSGGIYPAAATDIQPWQQSLEGIEAPLASAPDGSLAMTFMPVSLPDGVQILSLRAVGQLEHTSGDVSLPVRLERRQLTIDPAVEDTIDRIVQVPSPRTSGPFDTKEGARDNPRIPGLRRVDNNNFSYFLRVTWRDSG